MTAPHYTTTTKMAAGKAKVRVPARVFTDIFLQRGNTTSNTAQSLSAESGLFTWQSFTDFFSAAYERLLIKESWLKVG